MSRSHAAAKEYRNNVLSAANGVYYERVYYERTREKGRGNNGERGGIGGERGRLMAKGGGGGKGRGDISRERGSMEKGGGNAGEGGGN